MTPIGFPGSERVELEAMKNCQTRMTEGNRPKVLMTGEIAKPEKKIEEEARRRPLVGGGSTRKPTTNTRESSSCSARGKVLTHTWHSLAQSLAQKTLPSLSIILLLSQTTIMASLCRITSPQPPIELYISRSSLGTAELRARSA